MEGKVNKINAAFPLVMETESFCRRNARGFLSPVVLTIRRPKSVKKDCMERTRPYSCCIIFESKRSAVFALRYAQL